MAPFLPSLSRLERVGFGLLVMGTALYGKACGQGAPPVLPAAHTIFAADGLVAQLDSIADTATIEHFRCLIGTQVGDTLAVVRAFEPEILFADYNGVKAGKCPQFTVGTWHNHLPFNIPMSDPHNRRTPVEPWSVCELSPLDRLTTVTGPWTLAIISVANGVHCAWQHDGPVLTRVSWALP